VTTLVRRLGIAVVFGAITMAAIPASAQEISFGYQWQQVSVDDDEEFLDCCTAPFGINFDAAFPITPAIDVVGQLDWSRWSDSEIIFGTGVDISASFTTFGGGIRWSARGNPSATPFVHALLGAVHTSFACEVAGIDCDDVLGEDLSSTDFMFQVGGGVVVPLGGIGVVGQFDYRRFFYEGEGANSIRFVAGIRVGLR
jgi:Outer membrane protein beta-barrel domain